MILTSPTTGAAFLEEADCRATLIRLIGNLGGFFYRRRDDPAWTMDFISPGCRDLTGYDPHRFVANASIAFGDLVSRADWKRVNAHVRLALLHRRRATARYRLRTAYGAWVLVEDRFAPVLDAEGQVLAVEGVIDRARGGSTPGPWLDVALAPTEPRDA